MTTDNESKEKTFLFRFEIEKKKKRRESRKKKRMRKTLGKNENRVQNEHLKGRQRTKKVPFKFEDVVRE